MRYYGGEHYVWCTPNATVPHANLAWPNPPTSNPFAIYRGLHDSVRLNDKDCPKIKQNRIGVVAGADAQFKAGKINDETREEIKNLVANASIGEFSPILYVISADQVASKQRTSLPSERARVLSRDIIIAGLPGNEFDTVEIPL